MELDLLSWVKVTPFKKSHPAPTSTQRNISHTKVTPKHTNHHWHANLNVHPKNTKQSARLIHPSTFNDFAIPKRACNETTPTGTQLQLTGKPVNLQSARPDLNRTQLLVAICMLILSASFAARLEKPICVVICILLVF